VRDDRQEHEWLCDSLEGRSLDTQRSEFIRLCEQHIQVARHGWSSIWRMTQTAISRFAHRQNLIDTADTIRDVILRQLAIGPRLLMRGETSTFC